MTARVFIVDDHPLVRSGVRTERGETVEVIAMSALGIKGAAENVVGLVFALYLEPVFWVTQVGWLLWLVVLTLRRSPRPPR